MEFLDTYGIALGTTAAELLQESSTELPAVPIEARPVADAPRAARPTPVVAETPPATDDAGVDIFSTEQWYRTAPVRRETRRTRKRAGIAAVALAVAAVGAIETAHTFAKPSAHSESRATGSKHHGKHHQVKSHESKTRTVNPNASLLPSVAATANTHHQKLTPYVLTAPSTESSPSVSPFHKPQKPANFGFSGAAFTTRVATLNQKNSLPDYKFQAAIDHVIKLRIGVLLTQETGPNKYPYYRHHFDKEHYGIFPKTPYQGIDQLCSRNDAIVYDETQFEVVKHEFLSHPQYPEHAVNDCGNGESAKAGHANAPILWLRNKTTGREMIVINVHNIANVEEARGHNPALRRYETDELVEKKVEELQKEYPGVPIILGGDFNEDTNVNQGPNTTYKNKKSNVIPLMMEHAGVMTNLACEVKNCQDNTIGGIDYLFGTGFNVRSFHVIPSGGPDSNGVMKADHEFLWSGDTVPRIKAGKQ